MNTDVCIGPALRGRMGVREYFVCAIPAAEVVRRFEFTNPEIPAEHRAQRVLARDRVPQIRDYILQNRGDYIFGALTGSYELPRGYRGHPFQPDSGGCGQLIFPSTTRFLLNDGQHRHAGLAAAIMLDPSVGDDIVTISLFPFESINRAQQMFSDLNRSAKATTKSLNVLYDHRDPVSALCRAVVSETPFLKSRVEMAAASLARRSAALITLGAMFDTTQRFLLHAGLPPTEPAAARETRVFWSKLVDSLQPWQDLAHGLTDVQAVRTSTICAHAITFRAIGQAAGSLWALSPESAADQMWTTFKMFDWRRANPELQGVIVRSGEVVNRNQSQRDLAELLRVKFSIATPDEIIRRVIARIDYEIPNLDIRARLTAGGEGARVALSSLDGTESMVPYVEYGVTREEFVALVKALVERRRLPRL